MKATTIDINCDLGEGESQKDCDLDALLMPYISSCNIACTGHAGNEFTMGESLRNAHKNKLKIGAHPGYPDKKNFGRISLPMTENQLAESLINQIDSLITIAAEEQCLVQHIKFHGALYNDAENDPSLALQLAKIIHQFYPSKTIIGLAGGTLETASKDLGLCFLAEGFIDRSYRSDGKLTPRSVTGAIIEDQKICLKQAIALATKKSITTIDKQLIKPRVDSLCLHSDNPQALLLIIALNEAFKIAGIDIQ